MFGTQIHNSIAASLAKRLSRLMAEDWVAQPQPEVADFGSAQTSSSESPKPVKNENDWA